MGGTAKRVGIGLATGGLSEVARPIVKGLTDTPTVPNMPGLSAEEAALLSRQNEAVNQYQTVNQGLTGLYNPDGSINKSAVDAIRAQVAEREAMSMGYLRSAAGASGNLAQQEADLYSRALSGNEPLSAGLQADTSREFAQLKEAASRRGIKIQGTSLDDASADSTAGIRLIGELKGRYNVAREAERNNLRQTLGTQNLNRLGYLNNAANAAASIDPFASRMGYLNNATVSLQPVLASLAQPYQQQRTGQYNVDVQNAQLKAQANAQLWNAVGQLGGTALSAGLTKAPQINYLQQPEPQPKPTTVRRVIQNYDTAGTYNA